MNSEKQPRSNSFLWKLDNIKKKFSKTSLIAPEKLFTENRKDIDYRIQFLQNVLEKKYQFKKTLYYHFISDYDKGIGREPILASEKFIKLFEYISTNGIQQPLLATKINSNNFDSRYVLKDVKFWKSYSNKTGFQLIQGAHRLAIAIYLQLDVIPVKIFSPLSFEIPNYTDYIALKETEYIKLMR